MSINLVNFPEVDKEIYSVLSKVTHLAYGYRQAQMAMLSVEVNLPLFGRLFELIKQLQDKRIEELMRFELSRGKKITLPEMKPFQSFDGLKAVDILKTIFAVEKDLHLTTVHLCKLASDKGDMTLVCFLQDKVLPKQRNYIRIRAGMIHDLERNGDEMSTFIVGKMKIPFQIAKLEKKLRSKITKRERWWSQATTTTGHSRHHANL